MRAMTVITVLALAVPVVAGAALGDVLASWETPSPGRNFNGLAYDGEYVWVKNNLSDNGWVFRCTTTGSVVAEIAFPYRAPTYYSYGLAFDGEYLWTIYQWYRITYHDDYRKYTTTGSYVDGFGLHYWYGSSCLAVTWDGSYLWTDSYDHRSAEKVSTSGSIVASMPMPLGIGSDMAYYKRQLWYYSYSGAGLIYGVTLNGSVVASFPPPGGRCDGTAFDGEYLWTIDHGNPQYVYKVDLDVVDVAPASVGKVKALFR